MTLVHRFFAIGGVELVLLAVAAGFGVIAVIRSKNLALAVLLAGLVTGIAGFVIIDLAMARLNGGSPFDSGSGTMGSLALGRRISIVGAILTLVGWILLAVRNFRSNQSTDPTLASGTPPAGQEPRHH